MLPVLTMSVEEHGTTASSEEGMCGPTTSTIIAAILLRFTMAGTIVQAAQLGVTGRGHLLRKDGIGETTRTGTTAADPAVVTLTGRQLRTSRPANVFDDTCYRMAH